MTEKKKIGILTSGGDCAGLNAVIRAVVNSATEKNWEVYGIFDGTEGLTETPLHYELLTLHNFSDTPWPRVAGSYLGSLNKGIKADMKEAVAKRFSEGVKKLGLDAVIVVGGDGSMTILSGYCKTAGINMIGIPKTMDNDTPVTEFSVGFNSALQECVDAVDALNNTARSHHRAIIVEVMGRDTGHLAMHTALGGFADVCLVPEIPYSLENVIKKLKEVKASGRTHSIIVVSEAIKTEEGGIVSSATNMVGEKVYGGIAEYLNRKISEKLPEFQIRTMKMGHLPRGRNPIAVDRIMASIFGAKAVELIEQNHTNEMVALKNGRIVSIPLEQVVAAGTTHLDPNGDFVQTARKLGMYVGEFK